MRITGILGVLIPLGVSAEIVLTDPAPGRSVPLVPQNQKALIAMPGHTARKSALAEAGKPGKKKGFFDRKNLWRQAQPVIFRWRCTAGEKGPCRIMLAENPDFSDAKVFLVRKRTEFMPPAYELNLKLGQKYYWRVSAGKVCSETAEFTTETHPPRWIASEGKVANIRDLGGWKTAGNFTVKQGVFFRGEGLNEGSADGVHAGRSRLMIEDIRLFCDELGIRTDLDLRRPGETADLKSSPLGERVKFIQVPTESYWSIFTPKGKKSIAEDFRILMNPENHPVYFHCQAGRDRTGTLAFLINGVLGVAEKDLASDFEQSLLPWMPALREKDNYDEMVKGFAGYGKPGDSLNTRIEKYLLTCGITAEEIAAFRKIMLVK